MNWIKLILHYTKKQSYKSSLTFYGTVVHEKKIFKWPTLFLSLSPFEEDLNHHLNKFEFQSCKKYVLQVWFKLTWCLILKDSFQYTNVKIVPPLVYPTLTLGDHNLYKLKSAISQKALIKIWAILAQWFSRKNLFNDLATFLHFCDYLPFEKEPALYQYNLNFPLPKDDLYQVWLKSACWLWRRFFFQYKHVNMGFPTVTLPTPGDHAFHKLKSTLCQKAFM
jgi:hypothetical protein